MVPDRSQHAQHRGVTSVLLRGYLCSRPMLGPRLRNETGDGPAASNTAEKRDVWCLVLSTEKDGDHGDDVVSFSTIQTTAPSNLHMPSSRVCVVPRSLDPMMRAPVFISVASSKTCLAGLDVTRNSHVVFARADDDDDDGLLSSRTTSKENVPSPPSTTGGASRFRTSRWKLTHCLPGPP